MALPALPEPCPQARLSPELAAPSRAVQGLGGAGSDKPAVTQEVTLMLCLGLHSSNFQHVSAVNSSELLQETARLSQGQRSF